MLDGGADALPLQAHDIGYGEFAGEDRVFRIAFKIAPIGHRAMDIGGRRQKHMRLLGLDLIRQGRADLPDQVDIPGGAQRNADREAGRLDATDQRTAAARAIGPIGDAQLADAEPFNRRKRPEILAGQEGDFFLKRKLVGESFDAVGGHGELDLVRRARLA